MMEKLREYFMKVSDGNEEFTEEMTSAMEAHIKKEAPKSGSTTVIFYGTDVNRAAKKTCADLTKYFFPGDLNHFEMEVTVVDGQTEEIVYVDGFRKTPVEII